MTSTKAKSRPNKNFFSKQRKHKHHLCKCCTNNCRAAGAAISIFVQTVAQTPVSHRRHCNINSRANSRANSLTNSRSAQSSRKINKHSTQTRRSTPLPRAHPSRHDSRHRSRAPTLLATTLNTAHARPPIRKTKPFIIKCTTQFTIIIFHSHF